MILDSPEEFTAQNFDYLIVGGGTAGLVVANRLSENPNIKVGVIEAGLYVQNEPLIDRPGLWGRTIGNDRFDWRFSTVPQSHCNERRIGQTRGKVLGGSSALHFMNMTRACKGEYDAFEQLGNPGWNWNDILQYFKKSESIHGFSEEHGKTYNLHFDPEYHGTSGPLQVSYSLWYNSLHLDFIASLNALGVPFNRNGHTGDNVGVGNIAMSIDPKRSNFVVITDARVAKVVLQAADGGIFAASGVDFIKDGKIFSCPCSREVILAAGSYQTPQLLELSGIGAEGILKKHNIPQIVDLPGVGENLRMHFLDHPFIPTVWEMDAGVETLDMLRDHAVHILHDKLYLNQQGMYAGMSSDKAFVPLQYAMSPEEIDKLKSVAPSAPVDAPGLAKQFALQTAWLDDPLFAQFEFLHSPMLYPGIHLKETESSAKFNTVSVVLSHPFARGSVHITSNSPSDDPAIDPRYLSESADLEIIVAGLKMAARIMETEPLKNYVVKPLAPPQDAYNGQTDEQLREFVKQELRSTFHPVGTASMLPREDGGVVDEKLLVYGTKNLRVVDLSIVPIELSCHTQATAYAIGEKAADIIKAAQVTT